MLLFLFSFLFFNFHNCFWQKKIVLFTLLGVCFAVAMVTKFKTMPFFADFCRLNPDFPPLELTPRNPIVPFPVLIFPYLMAWPLSRDSFWVSYISTRLHEELRFIYNLLILKFAMPKGNPIGSKSSVIKRRRGKKRSGFQGIPKWKKEAEKREPKDMSVISDTSHSLFS